MPSVPKPFAGLALLAATVVTLLLVLAGALFGARVGPTLYALIEQLGLHLDIVLPLGLALGTLLTVALGRWLHRRAARSRA